MIYTVKISFTGPSNSSDRLVKCFCFILFYCFLLSYWDIPWHRSDIFGEPVWMHTWVNTWSKLWLWKLFINVSYIDIDDWRKEKVHWRLGFLYCFNYFGTIRCRFDIQWRADYLNYSGPRNVNENKTRIIFNSLHHLNICSISLQLQRTHSFPYVVNSTPMKNNKIKIIDIKGHMITCHLKTMRCFCIKTGKINWCSS